jgi:hypothetical protein
MYYYRSSDKAVIVFKASTATLTNKLVFMNIKVLFKIFVSNDKL